jgi:hypothetical protein
MSTTITHRDIVHKWVHQWSDLQWGTKGAVYSTIDKSPTKKTSCYGSSTGGMRGMVYKSYNTIIGAVAWSAKKNTHVFLVNDPYQRNAYSATTNNHVWWLSRAIPANKITVHVSLPFDSYPIDKYCRACQDARSLVSPEDIKRLAAKAVEQLQEQEWTGTKRFSLKQNRTDWLHEFKNLKSLVDVFGYANTVSKSKLRTLEKIEIKLLSWATHVRKEYTPEELVKVMRKRAIAKLSKLKKTATEFLNKSELSLNILTDLGEPINADTCGKLIGATTQLCKTLDFVEFDFHYGHVAKIKSFVAQLGKITGSVLDLERVYDEESQKLIVPEQHMWLETTGILSWANPSRCNNNMTTFDAILPTHERCYTSRYCDAPTQEVRILIKRWLAGKPIHGMKAGVYTVISADDEKIKVGCHTFSTSHIKWLARVLEEDIQVEEKFIEFVKQHIN